MNDVMRVAKEEQLEQVDQHFEMDCRIVFSVKRSETKRIVARFELIYGVKISVTNE